MHPAAQALLALSRQVRARTLRILERAQPRWLTWSPPGTANHMAWHAGHILWVQDVLCIEPLTGRSELPSPPSFPNQPPEGPGGEGNVGGWATRFGQDSLPAADPGPWPDRDHLVALLTRQQQRIEAVLADADPGIIGNMTARDQGEAGMGYTIVHGFHDEACHHGEKYLLFKMSRARDSQ
jgi:hypothetical protein